MDDLTKYEDGRTFGDKFRGVAPRVISNEELQRDHNKISERIEDDQLKRKELTQAINQGKKQLKRIEELMADGNQLNMFPNG